MAKMVDAVCHNICHKNKSLVDMYNNNNIDFYISGTWVARLEADGDFHVKGDVIAASDIFNP